MFFKSTVLDKSEKDDTIVGSFADAVIQIRVVTIVFIALFLTEGVLDFKTLDYSSIPFAVRYYIIIPLMLIILGLSFTKYFVRIGQPLMLAAFILLGISVAVLMILDSGDSILLGMLILIETAGFLFIRIKFSYAVVGGLSILLFFAIGTVQFGEESLAELLPVLILLLGTIMVGMYGNHYIKRCEEKNIQNRKQNIAEKKHLERMMSEKVKDLSDSQTVTIFALAKLSESRDKDTGDHIERIGKYCLLLASKIEVGEYEKRSINKEDFMGRIELASALHDIGKVGVNDSILIKPGKLNAEEFEIMTCHTLIGSNTLDEVRKKYPNNAFINMGVEITRCHHEKFDGTGYPNGLKGEQIPLSARIVAITDVYDALISVRPYKQAYTHDRAMDIIVNLSGEQFDPMLIKIFEKCNREIKSIAYGHKHPFNILPDRDQDII
jgi:response regulator RpfG family c-di-GMP phosphodiesterase